MEINGAALGFGVAAVAGLTLALIGHPSTSYVPPTSVPAATTGFVLKSVSVDLPTSDVAFPGGAKADAIAANCLSCHSAGMVLTQPDLSKVVWTGIVEKMIHAYKAPVAEGDVAAIVDYLQETKGAK
jgi:hypothetical protein